ncbi:MAG: hypothetical protein RIA65_11160 [Woeseia sp.]
MNNDEMTAREREVLKRAQGIATDVQPAHDLWPGIAAAIDVSERPVVHATRRWPTMFAQAAAVLLLVGASSALTWVTMNNTDVAVQPVVSSGELTFEPVSGSFGSKYSFGPDFQDARDSLVVKLDQQLERLPAETRLEVEKNIDVIRAAIAEINKALAQEPDNVLLQELLLSTYSEELAMMQKVDGISHAVMRRTDI